MNRDGCALEQYVGEGRWVPVAIRYQRLSAAEKRLLNRGETISKDGLRFRRFDWSDRQALARIFQRMTA